MNYEKSHVGILRSVGDRTNLLSEDWNIKSIPKIAHFYWGNSTLPYMQSLSPISFALMNPDWDVRVYSSTERTDRVPYINWGRMSDTSFMYRGLSHWEDLEPFSNIQVVNLKNSELPYSNQVFCADYLRWKYLSEVGGLWSDMDVLYFSPMTDFYLNTESICDHNEYGGIAKFDPDREYSIVCYLTPFTDLSEAYHSIGFLMGHPRSPIFTECLDRHSSSHDGSEYQSIGSILLRNVCPQSRIAIDDSIYSVDTKVVYPFLSSAIFRSLSRPNTKAYFTDRTIGFHWYAGDRYMSKYASGLSREVKEKDESYIGILLRYIERKRNEYCGP